MARNGVIAGIAAVTVQALETPVVRPLAALVTRRGLGIVPRLGGPPWLRDVVAILLLDYTLYHWHILAHRIPWLWRFHEVHHIDLDLDASTGLRFHPGELTASIPWRAAQILVIGVTPRALDAWQGLTLACVLFHHSNTRLGDRWEALLSRVLATPRMHAIHHSIDPSQMESNFSSGLSIWDHIHGTARVDADASTITVGVIGHLNTRAVTLRRFLSAPFVHRTADRSSAPAVP